MFLLARKESYCLNFPYLYSVFLKGFDFDGIFKFFFLPHRILSFFTLFLLFYSSQKLLQIKGDSTLPTQQRPSLLIATSLNAGAWFANESLTDRYQSLMKVQFPQALNVPFKH